jgi:hypothetical protein
MFIPVLCLAGLVLAPALVKQEPKAYSVTDTGVVISTDFVLKVMDVNTSGNGFVYCKFYNERTNSMFIGPCSTTDNVKLLVGAKYNVTKSNISNGGGGGNTISINKAELIEGGGARLKVVATFVRARTSLAELENGQIIGGENLSVGDLVIVN